MAKGPGISWYRAMNKHYAGKLAIVIQKELAQRPDLIELLKEKVKSFLVWAGWERLDYVPDIDEEVKDFLNLKSSERKRAYYVNAKEWLRKTKKIFERDNYTCQYCGKVGGVLECDHVVPFSKGGSDELDNLTTACRSCNRSKRDKSADEFKVLLKTKHYEEQPDLLPA